MSFRSLLLALLKVGVILGLGAGVAAGIAVIGVYLYLAPGLPPVVTLKDIKLQTPLRVFSRDGKLLAEYGEKRRRPLSLDEIP
ncbi:MAG: hypothetical protein ACR2RB_12095, partial [Gammaproteobacteria bacterium]